MPGTVPGTESSPARRAPRRVRDASLSEGLPPARYPVSKTGGPSGLGGSTPSPSASRHRPAWRHGRARQGSALLARRRATVRRFESCCLRSIVPVWSSGETRDCYSRSAGSNPAAGASRPRSPRTRGHSCPCGRSGDDAGLSTRKLRVRIPPGVLNDRLLAVGERATPPVSGTGDRRFDSCQPDLFRNHARWRSGCPREPHELETVGSNPTRAIE